MLRLALAGALALVAGLSALIAPAPAGAVRSDDVGELLAAPCPKYRAIVQRTYSERQLQGAANGRFRVFIYTARLEPPVDWGQDPYDSRSYRNQLHGMMWMDSLFAAYRETRNLNMLRQARDLALDWAESNTDVQGRLRQVAWNQKATGDRAPYLAYATRMAACNDLLTSKQARTLLDSLIRHGRFLASEEHHAPSNFGLFEDFGLLLLADHVSFLGAEAEEWRNVAVARLPVTLSGRLSSEGVWLEQSTNYHFAVINIVDKFIRFTGEQGALRSTLRTMKAVAPWFLAPNRKLVQFGDTGLRDAPPWARERVKDGYTGLMAFPGAGYAFVRQPDSYLAVIASYHNGTHRHAEDLNFELFDRGHRLLVGPGNWGYDFGRAEYRYKRSSLAHSVLTVDGQSFPKGTPRAYGSGITATGQGDGWYAIEGVSPTLQAQGVAHARLFLYRPRIALVVVDLVRSAAPHAYQRYFQLAPSVEIQDRGAEELGLSAGGFAGTLHDAALPSGQPARTTVKGQLDPLQGFTFPSVRKSVPRWSIEYASQASDADHIATFSLDGTALHGQLVQTTGDRTDVTLSESGSLRYTISVTRTGSTLSVSAAGSP